VETDQTQHGPQAAGPGPPGGRRRRPGAFALLQGLADLGAIDLVYLDESGFAPTLPASYTWARTKVRPLVWDEPPQGRRLNVLGALAVGGAAPGLVWTEPAGKLASAAFLDFVWRDVAALPAPPQELPLGYRRARPCVVVLDNYSVHRSTEVQATLPDLERVGVGFYYLPPYSPELNRIEPLWRHVKHEELPIRSYRTLESLRAAVAEALNQHAVPLSAATDSTTNLPEAA
jgi:DDE superfamily endonuclease